MLTGKLLTLRINETVRQTLLIIRETISPQQNQILKSVLVLVSYRKAEKDVLASAIFALLNMKATNHLQPR